MALFSFILLSMTYDPRCLMDRNSWADPDTIPPSEIFDRTTWEDHIPHPLDPLPTYEEWQKENPFDPLEGYSPDAHIPYGL